MSDTPQVVEWSLEQTCPLRTAHFPSVNTGSSEVLDTARWVSKSPDMLVGGIFVKSYRTRPSRSGAAHQVPYPTGGVVVDTMFGEMGGLDRIHELCGSCPANILPRGLAGCYGSFYQPPDYPPLEAQVRRIIIQLGLEADVKVEFPSIEPIWRALWAYSPLGERGLHLVKAIVAEMLREDRACDRVEQRQLEDFQQFVDAAELAVSHQFRMHVRLSPPGHLDDGVVTVFPHCPLCKSLAQVKHRFLPKYPDAPQICRVCKTEFSPAHTGSMRYSEDETRLRDQLGSKQFQQFARDFMMAAGETAEAAESIAAEVEEQELAREAEWAIEVDRYRRSAEYLKKHVYHGLTPLPEVIDNIRGKRPEQRPWDTTWLDGNSMVVALHRARDLGVRVRNLMHRSEEEVSMSRLEHSWGFDPFLTLAQWRSEGCSERFIAEFVVPDATLYPELTEEEIEAKLRPARPEN